MLQMRRLPEGSLPDPSAHSHLEGPRMPRPLLQTAADRCGDTGDSRYLIFPEGKNLKHPPAAGSVSKSFVVYHSFELWLHLEDGASWEITSCRKLRA